MINQEDSISNFSIKELFNGGDNYIIPIYQRNYSWGEEQISQLIQDIIDYRLQSSSHKYYLGTLVIYERQSGNIIMYETIDGQQRLTTLSILVSYIKNTYEEVDLKWFDKLNLQFANRKIATDTLNAVYAGYFQSNIIFNDSIKSAYELIEKILSVKLTESKLTISQFSDYLLNQVRILRVPVPEDTDLNHYFEIMNNRGEQLEKHEILKSKLLGILDKSDDSNKEVSSNWFNVIWEACSNMEKYVQYGFTTGQRNVIFGQKNWNTLTVTDFDNLCSKYTLTTDQKDIATTKSFLSDIILGKTPIKLQQNPDDNPDRFNSVINFPNFLLHVLRIQLQTDIPLDDKRLLKTFEEYLPETLADRIVFVKEFAFTLLKCKFLFDKYIIKREFIAGSDRWSLKKLKWYENNKVGYVSTFGEEDSNNEENRTVLLLLSMFHVSTPTLVYKHWLNAALNYVYHQPEIKSKPYAEFLENLANAFLFDRFLAKNPSDYFEIIYTNAGVPKNTIEDIELKALTFGSLQNNLIFNYLDFLLWRENQSDTKIKNFEYTFRSSVEHYFPQHPMPGFTGLEDKYLNSFGNLCLISNSKNSRLSNFMPSAKKEYYAAQDTIDSIKQHIMMNAYKPENWNVDSIIDHNQKMTDLLLKQLDKDYQPFTIDSQNEVQDSSPLDKAEKWFEELQNTNKALLVRAIMCFGQIDFEIGWTSGGSKYNLYQWSRIKETEAYSEFKAYVSINNPAGLEEIIQAQLKTNIDLQEDSYRFVFVYYPEIMDYCKEGNFGWINDGKKIILLKGDRASVYKSCELYSFLLGKYLDKKYTINTYVDGERLRFSVIESNGKFELSSFLNWEEIRFEVWNNGNGQMHYELNRGEMHGNSRIIKTLKELGWDNNSGGHLYHIKKPFLIEIEESIENNIINCQKEIEKLINLLNG
jgi:hypothetical protein